MMDVNAYADYLVSLNLSERAVAILTAVRPGADGKPKPPVRAVGSRVGNSNVRYPSRKMGFVIECESGRPEYFAAMNFEFDPDVLEYYSQPYLLTLHYVSAGGRNLSVPYVPDFIVLRTNGVEFVECKSADGIAAQALEQPNRFKKTDGGEWLSPPAEAAVSGSGIDYRIWLPTDLTPQFAANLKYLEPHIRRSPNAYGTEEYARVLAYVQEHQGVTVDALVEKFGEQEAPALVRWLLAHSHLFCNLHKEFLLGTTGLFTSRDLVMATKYFKVGDTGWPVGLAGSVPSVSEQMSSAISYAYKHFGSVAFGVANWRLAILEGRLTPAKRPAERTLSLWKKRMANAEKRHGVGFLGLLPGYAGQGNRNPRIPDAVVAMADDVIKESYLVTAGMKRASAYRQFLARCVENCLGPIPSVPWFYERAAGSYNVMLARDGTTPARLRLLKETIPQSRRITKTDLAKYLNAWDQKPDSVSLGGQRNFELLMADINDNDPEMPIPLPDVAEYKQMVAKGILFKKVQGLVRPMVPAFQANVTAYVVALLAHRLGRALDLERIWLRQEISPELQTQVQRWTAEVSKVLHDSAGGRMISEWAKRPDCWGAVRTASYSEPSVDIPEMR